MRAVGPSQEARVGFLEDVLLEPRSERCAAVTLWRGDRDKGVLERRDIMCQFALAMRDIANMRYWHTRVVGAVEVEGSGGRSWKGTLWPCRTSIAFRKFVFILIAVGNYCWRGLEVAINVLSMPLQLKYEGCIGEWKHGDLVEALIIVQVRDEGNLNMILLMVTDWSVEVGEIFVEPRINRTWQRIVYQGGESEDMIKDDSSSAARWTQGHSLAQNTGGDDLWGEPHELAWRANLRFLWDIQVEMSGSQLNRSVRTQRRGWAQEIQIWICFNSVM